MAKRYPANVKQSGTWGTSAPNPHAVLGAAESGYRTLSAALTNGNIADADTVDVFVWKNAANWAIYEGAAYDHTGGRVDCSAATLDASAGTIADADSVTIEVDAGQTAMEVFGGNIALSPAPASPTDTGTAGEIAWDGTYINLCVASNTWVRWIPQRTW